LTYVRYARLKALEDRLLLLEDTGFLEHLNNKDNPKSVTAETKSGKLDSSSLAIIGAPPTDPNKRIAELVASLQKKSTEQTNNNSVQ
jgi:hypothetical protein